MVLLLGGGGIAGALLSPTGGFLAIGLAFAALGGVIGLYLMRQAGRYEEATRRYQRRRAELEARLSD